MANNIAKFTPKAVAGGYAEARKRGMTLNVPSVQGGMMLLILERQSGAWCYGRDRDQVEDGSRWAVNANTLMSGFVAWHAGQPTERMSIMGQAPIDPATLPPTPAKQGWQPQLGFELTCISGEDEGVEVVYKTNTMGGIEAVDKLMADIDARFDEYGVEGGIHPVITLHEDSYVHREHGRIYKPIFKIVAWADDEGNLHDPDEEPALIEEDEVEEIEAEEVEEPKSAPRRRRRAS